MELGLADFCLAPRGHLARSKFHNNRFPKMYETRSSNMSEDANGRARRANRVARGILRSSCKTPIPDSEADPRKAQRVLARPALMDDIGKKRKLNGRKNYVRSKKRNRFACGCGNIRVGAIAIA